ncbi:MAG: tetratricopeptide repeat protein [Planctomycetota bacterium]
MQRYRVNYPLLIGLVVGSVVLIGGGIGLYSFQLSRNAGRILERAEKSREEGDIVKAISLMHNYVSIREEDAEARTTLATYYADLVNDPATLQDPLGREKVGRALAQLKKFVREQPDDTELRRRLVDFLMSPGSAKEALDHVNQLINRSSGDTELQLLKSRCLFMANMPQRIPHAYKLVGYVPETESFDVEKAMTPDDVSTYVRLAVSLQQDDDDRQTARRVIEQVVEANPEDGRAYLARGQFLQRTGETDAGKEDLVKAYELAPEDPEVVVAYARMLGGEDETRDEAIAILEKCAEGNPEYVPVYQAMAALEVRRRDIPAAIKRYEAGIAVLPERKAQMLFFYKTRLQIEAEEADGARATIKIMRDSKLIPPPFIDYLEARLAMFDGEYFEAVSEFKRLQAAMNSVPEIRSELQFLMAFCYEKLGQDELALDQYNIALQNDALNSMAQYGRTRMMQKTGRRVSDFNNASIYEALTEELGKSDAEQDWVAFSLLVDEYVERLNLSEGMRKVIEGEILMRRKKYPEARKKLLESYEADPENLGVRRAAVKLFALDPDKGPVTALKLLEKVVKDFGDKPILRLEKADLLVRINDEDVSEQLLELTEGTSDWSRKDQVQLWNGLAQRFEQLRDREKRELCLNKVVELSPSDLATLERLFMMARQSDNESAMLETQKRIREVLGTSADPVYRFTEAHLMVSRYRNQKQDESYLVEANDAIKKALDERPKWHQLHQLKAEVALLRGDEESAVKSFDLAAEYGPPTALSLLQHVKLLVKRGRPADAVVVAKRAPAELRVALLGRDYANSLLASGQAEEAIKVADEIARKSDTDGANLLWHGKFLVQAAANSKAGEDPEARERLKGRAGESFAKAIELIPRNADAWLSWISYLIAQGERDAAQQALREAELRLEEDRAQLIFARCYEVLGRWIDAEERYITAYEDAIPRERPRAARLLATFYTGPLYPRQDKLEKSTPLVNEVLRLVADGELDANDTNARWARTTAARLLAGTREYQKLLDAERLLRSNALDGQLAPEDRLLMAEILASRPEPVSRLKAVALYEKLSETQRLSLDAELRLGRLYFSLGQWRKCREQMINAIARYPKEAQVRVRYLGMLLERGGPSEIDEAVRQVRRLAKLAPNELQTREIAARVAMKQGKEKEAYGAVRGMLPRRLNAITPEQFPLVLRVAGLLDDMGAADQAEPLFKLVAERGDLNSKAAYAKFVGASVDSERGLAMLGELRDEMEPIRVIQRALLILRSAREEDAPEAPKLAATIEKWLTSALREDPELTPLIMQRAELMDLKGEYAKAAEIYGELLEVDDLSTVNRAIILNNFAYLQALTNSSSEAIAEARRCVDEAVEILGPGTDILDTRAVVAIADKRYDEAIADLKLSVIDRPTPTKYFHKAIAHLMAGQTEEAMAAWKEATDRGLSEDDISDLEIEQFRSVKEQLEGLGMQSASL